MARKSMFMGSTDVPAARSISQITDALREAGALTVQTTYTGKQTTGLAFSLQGGSGVYNFVMPVRSAAIFERLNSSRRGEHMRKKCSEGDRNDAERIAWRQLFRWVEAQLAHIDLEQGEAEQVFMPYMVTTSGETVYALFKASEQKRLTA